MKNRHLKCKKLLTIKQTNDMSGMGRAGTQIKFDAQLSDFCSGLLPRENLETVPFVGVVAGETPAVRRYEREVRRKDVGVQKYASGTPAFNGHITDRNGLLTKKAGVRSEMVTSHGNVKLTSNEPDFGFAPTADSILFLRSEYLGSRQSDPPARYFP